MTIEEAKQFVGTYGTFTKNQYDVQIDKIYNDFKKEISKLEQQVIYWKRSFHKTLEIRN